MENETNEKPGNEPGDAKQPTEFNIVCPYCGADPMKLHAKQTSFAGGVVVLVVACANRDCRKVISGSFFGFAEPQIVAGRQRTPFERPPRA